MLRHREKVLAHAEQQLRSQGQLSSAELLSLYKKFLKIENHRIRLKHHSGGGGREICAQRASLVDVVLRHLLDAAVESSPNRAKLPKIAQPNKTFYDKGTLGSGPSEIRYGYISDAAHTDGDLYVYFPQQNVLAVGGAAYGQGWPVVDWWTGGWIGGIVGGLQRIQTVANKDSKIIPANGPALSLADITVQVDMYGTIYDRLNQMLNKGRGPSEAVEAKVAKDFEAKMGNPDEFIRRSFESLWAYNSPDA